MTGAFTQSMTAGSLSLTAVGKTDIFVAKLSTSTGAPTWIKNFGGAEDDSGSSIGANSSGEIFVTGSAFATMTVGTTTLTQIGELDIVLLKLSAQGESLFAKNMGGINWDNSSSLVVHPAGGVVISGYFSQTMSIGATNLTSGGSEDIFVARFTDNGNLEWAKRGGGNGNDQALATTIDVTGHVWITGYFAGTLQFDDLSATTSAGDRNVFVAQFDGSSGNVKMLRSAGAEETDFGSAISIGPGGVVHIAGLFREHDPVFGITMLTNNGSDNAFIWRIFLPY